MDSKVYLTEYEMYVNTLNTRDMNLVLLVGKYKLDMDLIIPSHPIRDKKQN